MDWPTAFNFGNPSLNQPRDDIWTIGQLLTWTTKFFSDKKLDSPRLDAEVLLSHVLVCRRIDLYTMFDAEVLPADRATFRDLVRQRSQGKPVAYLVGRREFYSLDFEVDPKVLIPRPETEVLVSRAIASLPKERSTRVLDVGTGSGAIAIALAHHRPLAKVIAIDIEPGPIEVAGRNLIRHHLVDRVELRLGTWTNTIATDEHFDLIVSNPPYVRDSEFSQLSPEVRDHEPRCALVAGPDGLDVLRELLVLAPRYLVPGGWLMVEFGIDQAHLLLDLVQSAGCWTHAQTIEDDARRPRVLVCQL